MAIPASPNARLFYRCAFQRLDEATILRQAGQITIGAVYLAGYGVECILKAMILNRVTSSREAEILRTFRGRAGHDLDALRRMYLRSGGARFPPEIARAFTLTNDWSTELRYLPKVMKVADIDGFLKAAKQIVDWADERI